MKILTIVHSREIGGWLQRVASDVHDALSKDGHSMMVLTAYDSINNEYFCGDTVILGESNTHHLTSRIYKLFFRAYKIYSTVRRSHIECVISHGDEMSFSALVAWFFMRWVKILPVLHQDLRIYRSNPLYRFLFWLLFPIAREVVLVSRSLESEFRMIAPWVPYEVIQNGVHIEKIQKESLELTNISWLPEGYFLAIGRLTFEKWWTTLFRVFREHLKSFPESTLVILGDGGMKNELIEFIEYHQLEKNIFILWIQNNPWSYFRRARAFVLPTRYESLGLVFVESLSLWVPIISSDIPALRCIHSVSEDDVSPMQTQYWYMVPIDEWHSLFSQDVLSLEECSLLRAIQDCTEHRDIFSLQKLQERAQSFSWEFSLHKWRTLLKKYEL